MNFHNRLTEIMTNKDITAYRLAKDIGVQPAMVGRWMKGENIPSVEKLASIADYFGVSTDYLLGRADDPTGDAEVKILGYVDDKGKQHVFDDLTGEELQKLMEFADLLKKAREK